MKVAARLAGGEMRDHLRIYVVIILVVALTMGAFLLLTAYEQYMVQVTQDSVSGTISGDGMVLAPGVTRRQAYGGAPSFTGAADLVDRIEQSGSYRATPRFTVQGAIPIGNGLEGAIVRGIDPDTDERVFSVRDKITRGTYFTDDMQFTQGYLGQAANAPPSAGAGSRSSDEVTREFSDPYPIIVGETFFESQGLELGQTIQVLVQTGSDAGDYNSAKGRIVGVYDVGLPLMSQLMHFMHIDSVREMSGAGADSATEIAVDRVGTDTLAEPGVVEADLTSLAGGRTTYSWHDIVTYVSGTMMDTINILLYGTMTVTLVLAGAAIHHVMDGIVLRKIREIGSLKAFGARDRTVLGLFLIQALVLGLAAGLLGIGIGYGVTSWARAQGLQTEFLAGSAIDVDFVLTPMSMAITVLIPVAVSLLASFPPAWRAARLPPVEALRKGELAL